MTLWREGWKADFAPSSLYRTAVPPLNLIAALNRQTQKERHSTNLGLICDSEKLNECKKMNFVDLSY